MFFRLRWLRQSPVTGAPLSFTLGSPTHPFFNGVVMHPKGSGWYALVVGLLFIGGVFGSFFTDVEKPLFLWLIRAWLFFAGGSLAYWGSVRIKNGSADMTVGQDTINMVNGVFASTIPLLALMFGK